MGAMKEVFVPDIGDFKDVDVVEVLVHPGDEVKPEQSLITVESDKATMEIPSPAAGVVKELKVKVGDKVSQGSLILLVDEADSQRATAAPAATAEAPAAAPAAPQRAAPSPASAPARTAEPPEPRAAEAHVSAQLHAHAPVPFEPEPESPTFKPHASPSVRKFARELGVDLTRVRGSGPKGRVTQPDV
jgi:pyruvate dehydrogenase E2 component (dihydrolipoamide acetyltransferase)